MPDLLHILERSRAKAKIEPWRLHFPTAILLGMVAKGLRIPKDGWNAESFARQGRLLIMAIDRMARITRRKAEPVVARAANKVFSRQIDKIIARALRKAGTRSWKAESIEISVDAHEDIWAQAIREVLAEEGIAAVVEIVPPVQSVMAQGYSKVSAVLGQPSDPDLNPRFTQESRRIAERITNINETTRKVIERKVVEATREGLTVNETAEKIRREVPPIQRNRSQTIARTELNNAWTQGSVSAYQQSEVITHVSVIGCEAREPGSPTYRGESTCNIQDVPVIDADKLEFHINHTGTLIPSRMRRADGTIENLL